MSDANASAAAAPNRKRRAEDGTEDGPNKRGADANIFFRLLCSAHKIGSIIGKGGEIISRIRQETGARVKVEDPTQGCPERVILMSSGTWESEQQLVPAQSAILAIIERLYVDDKLQEQPQKICIRLLIDRSQTGPVLGRGGSIITKMRQESGASIKILNRQDLPACAKANDDMVEIQGDYDDCRQAVLLVSQRLRESPAKAGSGGFNRGPQQSQEAYDVSLSGPADMSHPPMGYGYDNPSLSTEGFTGEIETVFRLLCPDACIGCVIGKGGEVVKRIRNQTGAFVKVVDKVEGCPERVVHCSSKEDVHSPVVSATEAVLHCINCLLYDQGKQQQQQQQQQQTGQDPNKSTVRMLVPANQIGAVLGKGGSTIKQIRSSTGAHLVVLPREKTPACGERSDEVLTVEGPPPAIMDAMSMVASLLRNNMIRTQGVQMMPGAPPPQMAPPGSYPPPAGSYPPPGFPGHHMPPAGMPAGMPAGVPLTLVSTQPGMAGMQLAPGMVDVSQLQAQGYQVVSVQGGHPQTYQVVAPRAVTQAPPQPAPAPPQTHYTYVQTPQTWQPGADPALTATGQVGAPMGNQPPTIVSQAMHTAHAPHTTYTTATQYAHAVHASMPPSYAASGPTHMTVPAPSPAAMAPASVGVAPGGGVPQAQQSYVPVTTVQTMVRLLIQQHQVGPLLGRNGANINHVRQNSGAHLKLHDPFSTAGDRELEIRGTYEQTQEAQRLVSEILTAAAAQGVVS